MKRFTLLLLFTLFISSAFAQSNKQQPEFQQSFGTTVKASTNGIGADIYWNFMPKLTVRVGYETLKLKYNTSIEESDFELDADLKFKTGSVSAMVDYQITNWFYAVGGFGISFFKPEIKGIPAKNLNWGDVELLPETMGSLNVKIKSGAAFSPYLGVGFGKVTPNRRVSFGFELGAYYIGSPKLEIDATGMLTPSQDPSHIKYLENQLSDYKFYPVIKFNIGIKLFTLNK